MVNLNVIVEKNPKEANNSQKDWRYSKAEVLLQLSSIIKKAKILPQVCFTIKQYKKEQGKVLDNSLRESSLWAQKSIIVRSSALTEDNEEESNAGRFISVVSLKNRKEIQEAVDKVAQSFDSEELDNQIFVQPFLEGISISGVVFSRDPNSEGAYVVINYDDESGTTDSITSGITNKLKTLYCHRCVESYQSNKLLSLVIPMMRELEQILQCFNLDIEFAVDNKGEIYLFQVRPLVSIKSAVPDVEHFVYLQGIKRNIEEWSKPHPYLLGDKAIFGVMPDWNPAEIIGCKPKPLTLSLYREVVTDSIWAYQRNNYGYRNLRSFPLLVDLEGMPYIDVRVSFNSFIPEDLPKGIGNKLVNYYINLLTSKPYLHDKVEFDIVFSCYSFDLEDRLNVLLNQGFKQEEIKEIFNSLRQLTKKIINPQEGFWLKDLKKIEVLKDHYQTIKDSDLTPIAKMYWLIEDCKRYGTLPFAGLARAGFIAMQFLNSFVSTGIFSKQEYEMFLNSLHTVSSSLPKDFSRMSKEDFLDKYGHLRPGTYDILYSRYDEEPDKYFSWIGNKVSDFSDSKNFSISLKQLRLIQDYIDKDELGLDSLDLLEFIKNATEAREYSKFIFTKSISEFLKNLKDYSKSHGITVEESSYLDMKTILSLNSNTCNIEKRLRDSIAINKERYEITKKIVLPPLICDSDEALIFHEMETSPNFITQKMVSGNIVCIDDKVANINDMIVFIKHADPGFDWIFSHSIKGFVTQYGGINSHMAIRAAEKNIPAIIGAGNRKYKEWSNYNSIRIDCLNRIVARENIC